VSDAGRTASASSSSSSVAVSLRRMAAGRWGVVGLAGLLGIAVLARLTLYVPIGGGLELAWPGEAVRPLRLTAAATAAGVGAALAVSGVLLQALLRNPLASPFVLGVSAGASLGVALSLALVVGGGIAGPTVAAWFGGGGATTGHIIPAMIGAMLALAVVAGLGRRGGRGWIDPLAVLLAGVVVSAVCGSLVLALEHVVRTGLREGMLAWLTGTIDDMLPRGLLAVTLAATGLGTATAIALGPSLDVLSLGEDEARSVGASVHTVRIAMFGLAGGLTAVAVAVAGPIAFVGLIAPHAARGIVGARHRILVPAAALAGAGLLVAADAAVQLVRIGGGRLPVGVFTALIGGPLFLVLLRRMRGGDA
jgi:iron complex transport system permease protein